MRLLHIFSVYLLILIAFAFPLRAQEPAADAATAPHAQEPSADPAMLPHAQAPSPDQAELRKLTIENMTADQKTKKKLQQLNNEKEELRAQYELNQQKQKSKVADLEAELYRLSTENKMSIEKNQGETKLLREQLDKATLENKLAEEKSKAEIAALETEYQVAAAQNKLMAEQSKAQMAKQGDELQKLSLENKLSDENNKKAIFLISQRLDKLKAANDLKIEEQRELLIADAKERNAIDLEDKRLDLAERRMKIDKMGVDSRLNQLNSDLELRSKKEEWKKEANTEPVYLAQPFQNGRLVVSDRRIALNGPIYTGVADYVTERIHYYNNISSTQTIFVMIDNSPGGSVMEGYRIIKAMQASRAPVYVVVKSFAASMAAVIATMAEKSFVYPNAILLHHQMSTLNWGNMTQLKEQLELAREWERRLHVPVAKKMGVSLEDFRKMMYEKNSNGDWQEFGDKAVGYKWVTSVVDEIEETGFTKNPDDISAVSGKAMMQSSALAEKTDEKGQRYTELPRLAPFDFYFIYNPDRYYR